MDLRHPPAEVHVDEDLVRTLLRDQHAHLLTEPITLVDEGWDNFTYRLGAHHAVRLPRRRVAVALLLNEQAWLPVIADWLTVAVPRLVAIGSPHERFPWPWSVVEWIPGDTADVAGLPDDDAPILADLLRTLHRPAPADAPSNPLRGSPLRERAAVVEERLERVGAPELEVLWARALEAPTADMRVWLHGDLHPRNVVVRDGRLAGLLDWGDMAAGDASTDLACAWTLFDATARAVFREAYGPTDDEWLRAIGWAVNFASGLVDSGEPRHAPMGERIVRRLREEPCLRR